MFRAPEPPTPEEMAETIGLGMMTMVGALQPVFDTADGMKRDLEARGWSPALAEQVVAVWLATMMQQIAGGAA